MACSGDFCRTQATVRRTALTASPGDAKSNGCQRVAVCPLERAGYTGFIIDSARSHFGFGADWCFCQAGKPDLRWRKVGPKLMTAILGISAFYHDSAAALLVDGEVVAAAQEERFTRKKHDAGFPARAVEYCCREAGIDPADLDYVAFYEKPLTKFERLLETYFAYAPAGFASFRLSMPLWLKEKLFTRRTLRGALPGFKGPLVFPDHHESHAASAFFPSPFEEAAILTLDGVGEWSTTASGVGEGNQIKLTRHIRFPHSLGLLYSAFTYYCGFRVNSGEYKLMGLAPYGQPRYARRHLQAFDRHQARRKLPARHALFQLLRRSDDDESSLRRFIRRAAAIA